MRLRMKYGLCVRRLGVLLKLYCYNNKNYCNYRDAVMMMLATISPQATLMRKKRKLKRRVYCSKVYCVLN